MSVHMYIRMYIHMPMRMPIHMSVHIFVHMAIHMAVHTAVHRCIQTSTHMFIVRARTYLTVAVAYGTCTMTIWLTTTCPKTLIVTLWDVFESGKAKNRVNLTRSVCARCGDEVLCGAENAVFWMCANECV